MASRITKRHLTQQVLVAAILGAVAAAGLTQLASPPPNTTSPSMRPTATQTGRAGTWLDRQPEVEVSAASDSGVVGSASSDLAASAHAQAEGVMAAGVDRLPARPAVHATSGNHLAQEPVVRTSGSVVEATGVTVAAAVTNGHSTAHAFVSAARYGRFDLGPVAVGCRDGVVEATRTEVTRPARNITVSYGHVNGHRVVGATVLVTGPGDRVIRVIEIATVTCAAGTTATASSPAQNSRADRPDAPERRLVPRAPARPAPAADRATTAGR